MTKRAMLCPRCRRLIGSNEVTCSWCGFSRADAWYARAWKTGALDGEWLVKAIITANVAFYILSLLLSMQGRGSFRGPLSFFSPDQTSLLLLGATGTIPIERFGRVWTLLSANYLHGGILHLFFNLMALRQIAPWVTREFGANRMFIIYTLGGVGGFSVSYLAGIPFTIGASAALCGLIGSLLYYGRNRGGVYGAAVYREVSGWVVGLILFGLLLPAINNWAHGGGIIAGMLFARLLGYEEKGPETDGHRVISLICAVATLAVLAWAAVTALLAWYSH